MNTEDIQKRIDAMPAAMAEKGLAKPDARFALNANSAFDVYLHWEAATKNDWGSLYRSHFTKGDSIAEALDSADAFIAGLPSAKEAKAREFMEALGSVIELGRANGIDVDHVNPLVETMKRLSENILTDQRPPSGDLGMN